LLIVKNGKEKLKSIIFGRILYFNELLVQNVPISSVWIVKNQLRGLNFSTVEDRTKLWC